MSNSTLPSKFVLDSSDFMKIVLLYHFTNIAHTYANSKQIQNFLITCNFRKNKRKGTSRKRKIILNYFRSQTCCFSLVLILCTCRTSVIPITALHDAPDAWKGISLVSEVNSSLKAIWPTCSPSTWAHCAEMEAWPAGFSVGLRWVHSCSYTRSAS